MLLQRVRLAVALGALLSVFQGPVLAQNPSRGNSVAPRLSPRPSQRLRDMTLDAENSLWDNERELVELQGNVQIVRGDQHIRCDRAILYMRSQKVELFGNVEVTTPRQTLIGQEVLLDYETSTGLIRNGYVKSGNVLFEGEVLQKIGEDEFLVADSTFTSCSNCPSTWSFSGQNIRAEIGGYAYIKNSVMRIGGVPILWLPYLIVPLKSERQSGLLPPSGGTTLEGGIEFAQPYFWAIDRSSDLTFTLKNFEKRRLMGMVNYNYVLDERSFGQLDAHWIRDRVFTRAERLNRYRSRPNQESDFNRWYLNYRHQMELEDGWIQKTYLHNASDLQYLRDFNRETQQPIGGDPAMENRVNFTKNTHSFHTSIDTSYYVNLLRADPLSNNEDAVHRLPEITFSQTPTQLWDSPLLYSWTVQYTNFARASGAYDDLAFTTRSDGTPIRVPTNNGGTSGNDLNCDDQPAGRCEYTFDGVFDPATDLIRTGQRLDLRPELQANFKVAQVWDITPRLAYRETRYFFPVGEDKTVTRRFIRTEVANRMTFSRIYGEANPESVRYKHLIEPEVIYSNIPWLELEDHPFFTRRTTVTPSIGSATPVSDGDLVGGLGIQFDENDRILDQNLVTFALTNRLVQRLWGGTSPAYRQVVNFRLAQSYNLTEQGRRGGLSPWSDLSGLLTMEFDNFVTNTNFNYFPKQNVTNVNTRTALINDKGQFFEVGLEKTYTIVQGQRRVDRRTRVEDLSFGLGFTSRPLNFLGQFIYDTNWQNSQSLSKIKSWGYVAQLKPPGECWQINFTHGQQIGGDTRIDVGFEFFFDGVPKPAPPRTVLNQFR